MMHEWPLLGRSEELRVIAGATRRGADRARGIVLAGDAGVGKTRLAREAVAACRPSGRSRWIAGTASARTIPLGAFADIVSDFGPDPLRRVREVIDGVIGTAPNGTVVVGVDDAHLLDDLSAQIAFHALDRPELFDGIEAVSNNHLDQDGLASAYALVAPDDALFEILKETHEVLAWLLAFPVRMAGEAARASTTWFDDGHRLRALVELLIEERAVVGAIIVLLIYGFVAGKRLAR